MKKIGLLLLLISLLAACGSDTEPVEPVETKPEPVRQTVSDEAYLVAFDDSDILLVEPDETSRLDLSDFSLTPVEMYHQPLMIHDELGEIFLDGTTLKSIHRAESATAITLVEDVAQTKPGLNRLLIKQAGTDHLIMIKPDGSTQLITGLTAEQSLEDLFVIDQGTFLVENHADGTFQAIDLTEEKDTNDITGQVILTVPDQPAVIFSSEDQPGKLGQLDLMSGDTTWYDLGSSRTSRLLEPQLIDDHRILSVYDNEGQAELVVFDLAEQLLQATDLGPAGEFIRLDYSAEGTLIHTKSRIYRSNEGVIDYFEFPAESVIRHDSGLILINNNKVRLIKDNAFKDYQFPGRVADAALARDQLIVLYASPEGRTLSTQEIDF